MTVILVLIPISLVLAVGFLLGFIWAVRAGQYDDTCTPSMRILSEDTATPTQSPSSKTPSPTPEPTLSTLIKN